MTSEGLVLVEIKDGKVLYAYSDLPGVKTVVVSDTSGEGKPPLSKAEVIPLDYANVRLLGRALSMDCGVMRVGDHVFLYDPHDRKSRGRVKRTCEIVLHAHEGSECALEVWGVKGKEYEFGDEVWVGDSWYGDNEAVCYAANEVLEGELP